MATSASTLDSNLTTGGTNTQALANWAAPYVTDLLGKAKAVSALPYETYRGPLTAGESSLQTQAMQGLAGLTVPSSIGEAAKTAGSIATNLAGQTYTPKSFANQYAAPTAYQGANFGSNFNQPGAYQGKAFANTYEAPTEYQAGSFGSQYAAPKAYQNTSFENQYATPVSSAFTASEAQQYMNPYLQAALEPQIAEARRQAQISQMQRADKSTQAGAFGGTRQAIAEAEAQRNLETNLANITGQGYSNAFSAAQQQFNAEQARKIQEAQLRAQYGLSAEQAAEASKQFGAQQGMTASQLAAQYGLAGQQATEASRQFGSQQKMTAAQLQAQYGLSAEQAAEVSRQFGAQQGMTGAQLAAQYGLAEKQAQEASRQFGSTQGMTAAQLAAQYGMSAQQAEEASKQFGSTYGLQSQQAALQAAQAQANLAQLQQQLGLSNISAQLGGGATQRGITAEGIAADKAEFEKQRQYPQEQLKFQQAMLSGLPISAVTNTPGEMSDFGKLLSTAGGVSQLASLLGYGGKDAKGYGTLSDLFKGVKGIGKDATESDLYKYIFGSGGTGDVTTSPDYSDWWNSAFGEEQP